MPPGSLRTLLRSTGFRLSAIYSSLLILTIIGTGLAGWIATVGLVERQTAERIQLEIGAIAHEIRDEGLARGAAEIGRASCRERGCQYVWISGVVVSLKNKNSNMKRA